MGELSDDFPTQVFTPKISFRSNIMHHTPNTSGTKGRDKSLYFFLYLLIEEDPRRGICPADERSKTTNESRVLTMFQSTYLPTLGACLLAFNNKQNSKPT